MDIRKLQRAIVDGLEDVKAQDILVFNTEQLSPLFERVIVASGTSNRQTKALAAANAWNTLIDSTMPNITGQVIQERQGVVPRIANLATDYRFSSGRLRGLA